MSPRYTVRAQADNGYYIWDNERNKIATSSENRQYVDLRLRDAFDLTDELNKQPKQD